MKSLRESPWRQRGLYFLGGIAVALLCGFVQIKWMDIVPYGAFDHQPGWLKALCRLVEWIPWLFLVAVLIARITRGRHVRIGFFFLGIVTPVVLLIGWILFGSTVDDLIHRQKFNADAWRNQESTEHDAMWPPRLCMVDGLMASGRLDGMTQEEVIELLGPPEEKGFPFSAANSDIHYYLGPERGFIRIDSEWLFLKFGEDGKLRREWLYRD